MGEDIHWWFFFEQNATNRSGSRWHAVKTKTQKQALCGNATPDRRTQFYREANGPRCGTCRRLAGSSK